MAHPLTIQEAKDNLRAVAKGLRPIRGESGTEEAKARLRAAAGNWMDMPARLARSPWTTLGIACLSGFAIGRGCGLGTNLPVALLAGILRRFLESNHEPGAHENPKSVAVTVGRSKTRHPI